MLGFGPLASAPLAGSSQRTIPFDDITVGAVLIDIATFSQTHNLAATDVIFGTPVVDSAEQSNVNNLSIYDSVLYRPLVDYIEMAQDHQITVNDLETTPISSVGFRWRLQPEETDVWTLQS